LPIAGALKKKIERALEHNSTLEEDSGSAPESPVGSGINEDLQAKTYDSQETRGTSAARLDLMESVLEKTT